MSILLIRRQYHLNLLFHHYIRLCPDNYRVFHVSYIGEPSRTRKSDFLHYRDRGSMGRGGRDVARRNLVNPCSSVTLSNLYYQKFCYLCHSNSHIIMNKTDNKDCTGCPAFCLRWDVKGSEKGEDQPFWLEAKTTAITTSSSRPAYNGPTTFIESKCVTSLFILYKNLTTTTSIKC